MMKINDPELGEIAIFDEKTTDEQIIEQELIIEDKVAEIDSALSSDQLAIVDNFYSSI